MATITRESLRSEGLPELAGRLLAFVTASHQRAVLFLVLASWLAFLPGFFQIPPVDRDEARFAQATKQMLETGDYVDIRFQHDVRYKKPVGIYWLQAGVVKAGEALGIPRARTKIWLYRIPSLIGATGAVLLTYWTALAFVNRRYAYLAGLMLAASVLLGVEARLAKTDAMLLLTILAAQGALARAYLRVPGESEAGWRGMVLPAIFWTALAAGVLIKGPVIALFAGLTVASLVALDRSARWLLALRPAIGLIWFLVLVLPWFLAIMGRAGEAFLAESIGRDMLAKVFSGQESHGAPPGYYLLLFWVTFWPAAAFAILAAPVVWAERRERDVRFLLAWLVPGWLVFELVITKLPHYVLPLYPAVAILIARTMERGTLSDAPSLRWVTVGWPLWAAVFSLGGIVVLMVMAGRLGLPAWPLAAGAILLGVVAWRAYEPEAPERALVLAAASAILVFAGTLGVIAPSLRALFPSPALARAIPADCSQPLVASAGFHEPSLVFLVGTSIKLTDSAAAAEFLHQGPCRFALVESRHERAFARRAEAIGLRYSAGRRIDGVNINGGRALSIAIYRSAAAP